MNARPLLRPALWLSALLTLTAPPLRATEPATDPTPIEGVWDILSASGSQRPIVQQHNRVWHIKGGVLVANGERHLVLKPTQIGESKGRFQVANRVGDREIILYSCIYELDHPNGRMTLAFYAGDEFPPRIEEDSSSWHIVYTMKRRD